MLALLQPALSRSLWTVNGVRCTVGAAAAHIDRACHSWSAWNGRPLLEWSQTAYKWTLYKRRAGGQWAWKRFLMEMGRMYHWLNGERQTATRAAVKCLPVHMHTHSRSETCAKHTHVLPLSRTAHTEFPMQIKPSVELICVCRRALGQSPNSKHITHSVTVPARGSARRWGRTRNGVCGVLSCSEKES